MSNDELPRLTRIEERLDNLSTIITDVRLAVARIESAGLRATVGEHERRITSLERWKAGLIGAYALLAILYGLFTDWLKR